MSNYRFIVTPGEENFRIDKLLVEVLNNYSRTEIQSFIKEGFIKVNEQEVKPNYRCQEKDEIVISIPTKEETVPLPEDIPIEIIFEDDHIIVVNKPKGMVVYPTANHTKGTLVNALLSHTNELSSIGGKERPGIVHRLDKDTSGLLLIAKTDHVHKHLSKQFSDREVERIYGALVHGNIPHNKGVINAPIGRDPKVRTKMAVNDEGREAITNFVVKERYDDYTYVECELITGRTHQIRVHLHYIGHSIVGEQVYINHKTLQTQGQLLYAKSLGFIHPVTEEQLFFEIPMPKIFKNVIKNLGVD